MADSPTVLTFRPKDNRDLDLNDPNISFREKWNNHVIKKRTKGLIPFAHVTNRWVPRFFYLVCFGGTGWIVAGSLPHYCGNDVVSLAAMEIFTLYVFLQVMVNYYLTKYVDSSYRPDVLSSGQPSPRSTSTAILQSQSTSFFTSSSSSLSEIRSNDYNTNTDLKLSNEDTNNSPTSLAGATSDYRILVATSVTGNDVKRKSFPYWSWVPCMTCERSRPPRCHHCPLCKACVLKRDHHCYFTASCVGVNNQRYFMYFLLWCVVLTWLGSLTLVPYLFTHVLDLNQYSYLNLLFPYNLYTTVIGELPVIYLHLIMVVWGVVFLTFVSTGMFANSSYLLLRGMTYFESSHSIKVIDVRGLNGRLRAVFGRNWVIALFLTDPLSCLLGRCLPRYLVPSEPLEDAVNWPYIKTT